MQYFTKISEIVLFLPLFIFLTHTIIQWPFHVASIYSHLFLI